MTIQPILAAWSPLPLAAKLGIVIAGFLLLVFVGGAVGGIVTKIHDARFDKAQAEATAKRDALAVDRDAALRRAEAAEAKAAILEEQAVALKQVADSAALTAKQSQQKADAIAKETDISVASIGDIPPEQARAEIHDRLVRLGLLKDVQ